MIAIVLLLMFTLIPGFIFAGETGNYEPSSAHFSAENIWHLEHDISFSTNLYLPQMEANSNGVYPVVLDINACPDLLGVKQIEIEAYDNDGKSMTDEKRLFSNETRIILPEYMCPSEPGEVWFYRIRFINHIGHVSEWSDFHKGYGAITGEALIKYFEKYAMKPWEFVGSNPEETEFNSKWSDSEILEKVNAHSLKSLGDITEHSRFHDGSVRYLSKAKGFKGDIFFTYDNFGELETIKATGNFNMLGVSLSGNGKRCEGTIAIDGLYPATVDFADIVIRDYMPTGVYILTQSGRDAEHIAPKGNLSFGN